MQADTQLRSFIYLINTSSIIYIDNWQLEQLVTTSVLTSSGWSLKRTDYPLNIQRSLPSDAMHPSLYAGFPHGPFEATSDRVPREIGRVFFHRPLLALVLADSAGLWQRCRHPQILESARRFHGNKYDIEAVVGNHWFQVLLRSTPTVVPRVLRCWMPRADSSAWCSIPRLSVSQSPLAKYSI